MKELSQLAIDIYANRTGEFSKEDSNQALRSALIDLCGTDKIDYKTMRKMKPEVFEILEETLDVLVGRNIEEEFGKFAEYRNVAWGDSKVFELKNANLFKVAMIADGTSNLRRQRLDNGSVTVETHMRGIKIYEELYRFLAGRIDWANLVDRVSKSYVNELYTLVYKAIYGSYSDLGSTYGKTGSFSATVLDELIDHIEAENNASVVIYGTKSALAKVTNGQVSENMKDAFNEQGFYGVYNGTPMVKINQVHIPGTDTFAIDGSHLLILPQGGEQLVKIVDEGESIIVESAEGKNADLSLEYTFMKKSGLCVLNSNKYGLYKLS